MADFHPIVVCQLYKNKTKPMKLLGLEHVALHLWSAFEHAALVLVQVGFVLELMLL
jgi:hypothetical protein